MTVEAALIIPIFLFCFLNLLSVIEMYRLHANITASLWKNGRMLTQYSYLYQKDANKDQLVDFAVSELFTEVYVKKQIEKEFSNCQNAQMVLKGGMTGISLTGSSISGRDDLIKLYAYYQAVPFPAMYYGKTVRQSACFYGHTWTGYDLAPKPETEEEGEEYVYVAETGTVYHRNRYCTYLNPGIKEIPAGEKENKRNRNGEKYRRCPMCKPIEAGPCYYITPYGETYHSSPGCRALKRTIYRIRLSEAGDKNGCSKCGR